MEARIRLDSRQLALREIQEQFSGQDTAARPDLQNMVMGRKLSGIQDAPRNARFAEEMLTGDGEDDETEALEA